MDAHIVISEEPASQKGINLESIRQASMKVALSMKESANKAAVATGTAVSQATKGIREKDWTKEQEALNKVKGAAIGAADRVAKGGAQAVHAGAAVIQKTADQVKDQAKKVFGGPLTGIAKQEANSRPCPRLVLCCCTAIVSSGLAEPDIFKATAPPDDLYCLYGSFEQANGLVLPPTGTSPHVLAHVLKKFLITLPEPLLTFKFLPEFFAVANEPHEALSVMPKLPQVNLNTLLLLLETLSRVAEFSEHNNMDANALAEELAPCLAWHPLNKQKQSAWPWGSMGSAPEEEGHMDSEGYLISPRMELEPHEHDQVVKVLTYLIGDYKHWYEGVVFT